MLEYLIIFGKGGAILWTFGQLLNIKGDPINSLIRNCLLEDRTGEGSFSYRPPNAGTPYTLKWTFHNGLDLVFVAVHQQMMAVPFADALLSVLKDEFVAIYRPEVYEYKQFDDTYKRLLAQAQKPYLSSKTKPQAKGSNQNGQSQQRTITESLTESQDSDSANENDGPTSAGNDNVHSAKSGANRSDPSAGAFDIAALEKRAKGKSSKGKLPKGKQTKSASKHPIKKGKAPRNWNGDEAQVEDLDFSSKGPAPAKGVTSTAGTASVFENRSRMDEAETVSFEDEDRELEEQLRAATASKANGSAPPAPTGMLTSFITSIQTNIMGKEALTPADIAHAMEAMKKRLQQRNVSVEVAGKICASVGQKLEGQKLVSFTGVARMVRTAMAESITRILSPPRSIDVLASIRASKARGKPYSIVFVGVNGVGKSTNLAKIAYWLRQQKLNVMIAACDTFRSGAVEQLKTHCNRLGVALYDRGYDKDPTNVAGEAMRQAARDGVDVVLIDTAGRMQDNEPLMRALSMLINKNNPDLVLFVGEALVGNDGVNQLVTFNKRLMDLSPPGEQPRLIDGILVTKFDAIDDKVGAVLSMAYSSGAPIMFVGCGQTYVDLKRLDVQSVVKALLK